MNKLQRENTAKYGHDISKGIALLAVADNRAIYKLMANRAYWEKMHGRLLTYLVVIRVFAGSDRRELNRKLAVIRPCPKRD